MRYGVIAPGFNININHYPQGNLTEKVDEVTTSVRFFKGDEYHDGRNNY